MVRMEGYDYDYGFPKDHLGTVEWRVTHLTPSSMWHTSRYTFESSGGYYQIKYRYMCNSFYYGSLCEDYCKAQNDYWNGHYTCSSTGGKICNSGWTGTNCIYGKYNVVPASLAQIHMSL